MDEKVLLQAFPVILHAGDRLGAARGQDHQLRGPAAASQRRNDSQAGRVRPMQVLALDRRAAWCWNASMRAVFPAPASPVTKKTCRNPCSARSRQVSSSARVVWRPTMLVGLPSVEPGATDALSSRTGAMNL